jgi:hypothetical protein
VAADLRQHDVSNEVCSDAWLKLDGEASATLGAAGSDNTTATDSLHADEKAVSLFAACNGWLVSTFHGDLLLK